MWKRIVESNLGRCLYDESLPSFITGDNTISFKDLPLGDTMETGAVKTTKQSTWFSKICCFGRAEGLTSGSHVDHSTAIFIIQALVAWAFLCIPGNVTTLVLWITSTSTSTSTPPGIPAADDLLPVNFSDVVEPTNR